jgi:hypothetical protein
MTTLLELIKECEAELQIDILQAAIKKGEEFKISYVRNNKMTISTIFFPLNLSKENRHDFLTNTYGNDFEIKKVMFEDFSLDEQRQRVRALKIICGKFNDLWIK